MLKAFNQIEKNSKVLRDIETTIERELRYLILIMPLDETIILSPSFRYESPICMRILEQNRDFVDEGYIANYMQEMSEYDFSQKKSRRYEHAMKIENDYYEAYGRKDTYKKVNAMPMKRIPKQQQVGKNSREIFKQKISEKGKKLGINEKIVEEILKIIEETEEETFLWEMVEYNLAVANIDFRIVHSLGIREEMNISYLQVFQEQNILLPYNGNIVNLNINRTSDYDITKITRIMCVLKMDVVVNTVSAKEILILRNNFEFQDAMNAIRKGLKTGRSSIDICKDIQKKHDIISLVQNILHMKGDNSNKMYEEIHFNTLKLLHLSDLHLTDRDHMEKFYKLLKIDLRMQLHVEKIDYLIVSGDVCNRPVKEQYEVALEFCKLLIKEFKIKINNVIVVPGNHDCDRKISKEAYGRRRKYDEEMMKHRFDAYNDFFYVPLLNKKYSKNYNEQLDICDDPEHKIYIIGLNSAYLIDHINKEKSAICFDAILRDETVLNRNDYLKMAVWHHPLSGFAAIEDNKFMDTLAVEGYQICFHGHIHEAANERYNYDDKRNISIIGAGTFGAVKEDRGAGIPLQYNYVEIDTNSNELIVHTRKRENEDGAWMADARWGDKGGDPKSYYIVSYKRENNNS